MKQYILTCKLCKHFIGYDPTIKPTKDKRPYKCEAFKNGIPDEIYSDVYEDISDFKHSRPYHNDNGIMFELTEKYKKKPVKV